jgi:hypothetical protein
MHRGLAAGFITILLLSACGGSGSSGSTEPGTGTLTLGLTDAAADTAIRIQLRITGVTVKRSGVSPELIELSDPVDVDLLSLTDGTVATLLDREEMIAGEYEWMRMEILEDAMFTYVDFEDGNRWPLSVTSNRGLQLSSGFVITVDRNTHFVIDWDARQGLTHPTGQGDIVYLRPSLRVIDMARYGSIGGMVADALTMGDCNNDPATDAGNVVYVYTGHDVIPDDVDNNPPEPLVTAPVRLQTNGSYAYRVHFVPPGDYTVAFTCQGLGDDVPVDETDPTDGDDPIEFVDAQNATVVDDAETEIGFPAP